MKTIIDVSKHNGKINWEKVNLHVDGAILRCGYGDDIVAQDDETFSYNADECERLGIPYGVYIYSYAESEKQVLSEVAHCLRLIKNRKLSFPVYYDLEEKTSEKNGKKFAELFIQKMREQGYNAGIYANNYWWTNILGDSFEQYPKWVARYGDYPTVTYDMWQYTNKGYVVGISGNVDMNEMSIEQGAYINSKEDVTTPTLYYRAFAGDTLWPEVTENEDWAGKGVGVPITWLLPRTTQGEILMRVKTKNGWLPWLAFANGYNFADKVKGTVGDGTPIFCVQIVSSIPGYEVHYRVAPENGEFYPEQIENYKEFMDGFAGVDNKPISKFQMWLVKEEE